MEDLPVAIQHATILDLPVHILRDIFKHFEDPRVEKKGRIDFGEYRPMNNTDYQTLQSSRLTCRLLHDVASEFTSFCIFSVRPHIAQHIRGVQVWLPYCPGEFATDLAMFNRHCKRVLTHLHEPCYYCDYRFRDNDDYTPATSPDCESVRKISDWWDEICNSTPDEAEIVSNDPLARDYQSVLRRAFNQYQQQHNEQLGLLVSGSFAHTIASCVARLPNPLSLAFMDDRAQDRPTWGPKDHLVRDREALQEILSSPLSWKEIESLQETSWNSHPDGDSDDEIPGISGLVLTPARILTELPIAIHQVGSTVKSLYIGSFPCRGNFPNLCAATDQGSSSAVWSDLQVACQDLRMVNFGGDHKVRYMGYQHISKSESSYVNHFVGSIISSPELEEVELNLGFFGRNSGMGIEIADWQNQYDISTILASAKWPRARRLKIQNSAADSTQLGGLITGLGPSLESIRLSSVQLLNGSWVDILDSLRAKATSDYHSKHPEVDVTRLTGGEFEETKWRRKERAAINDVVRKYVSGVDDIQNPFSATS
ncbi:hypothetical protein FE257_002052 [Aspergillus nanangensis]|uniref:Uncharacterized protein n=1 Tax=Aspergillus nanangensis TaxID=2582783 RepID=A0AAD4CT90_ASPNN|nr:hypothetical protein FE257_002052 [Aspergillus nanangensis]